MRYLILPSLSFVAALGWASASAAQSGAPPTPQQATGGAIGRLTNLEHTSRFETEEMRRRNALTPEEAEARYGAERVAIADRVQALINEGQCEAARNAANEAGERRMALRVRQTCRPRARD